MKEFRINERIRTKEVRLIGVDGQQMGVVPLREAIQKAREQDLDLVEISPYSNPPVCRIMNYGKYKYEQHKKEKEARKKQKSQDVKEIWLRPRIEKHDFQVKFHRAENFLKEGNKVKITVRFKGREMSHSDLGGQILNELAKELQSVSIVEGKPKFEGRNITMVLTPLKAVSPVKSSISSEIKDDVQSNLQQEQLPSATVGVETIKGEGVDAKTKDS